MKKEKNSKRLMARMLGLVLFVSFFLPAATYSLDTKNFLQSVSGKIVAQNDVKKGASSLKEILSQQGIAGDAWEWMAWKEKNITVFHMEMQDKNYELIVADKNTFEFSFQGVSKELASNDIFQFALLGESSFQNFILKNYAFMEHIIQTEELKGYLVAIRFGAEIEGKTLYDKMLHKSKNISGNYTLAALVEDSEYYEDPYGADIVVRFIDTPVLRYTPPVGGETREDFYFYVGDKKVLSALRKFAEKSSDPFIRQKALRQMDAFMAATEKSTLDSVQDFYKEVSRIVKENYRAVNFTFIEEEKSQDLGDTIKRYFLSNGIYTLDMFEKDKRVILQVSNKFFILGTTYYYRNWGDISRGLDEISARLSKKRPLKVKVFACSTGEEVITYALHFLEMGIKDFYLLGSDINPNYIQKASSFRYQEECIERLPDKKRQVVYKYFKKDEEGYLVPKDPGFFREHVSYIVQDITKALPALDKRFSPPYDIVNIQNVLNYIDFSAIAENLEYWLALVDEGGLLVLRDRIFSPYYFKKSSLFRRFVVLNESCAVKLFKGDNVQGLMEEYQRRIDADQNLFSYLCLNSIYESRKELDKAYALLEKALLKYRFSFEILYSMGRIADQAGKKDLAVGYLQEAFEIFPVSVNVLAILESIAKEKGDEKTSVYLKSLMEANEYYLMNQGSGDPEEKIKKFRAAAACKEDDYLVYLSAAFASLSTAEDFVKQDKKDDAQSYCWAALEFIDRALNYSQSSMIYLLRARAHTIVAKIYSERQNYEKADFYIKKALDDFGKSGAEKKHFVGLYDFGKLYLLWGDVGAAKGENIGAGERYSQAAETFRKADEYLFEKRGYYLYFLLVNLAECYYKIGLTEKDPAAAKNAFEKAYDYTEQALNVNSVYGINADQMRTKIREDIQKRIK
jgi:chemotaxis methyl-accepting protein methylase